MKKCGILLPIFSLPSEYGIGTFGRSAYEFIDFLNSCGQSIWQILPLSPTSYGDSPYQSPSAFAGNPYFIDPRVLLEKGYVREEDLAELSPAGERIDYGLLYRERYPFLRKAYVGFMKNVPTDYDEFKAKHERWLMPYALFMAIKDEMGGCDFHLWPDELLHGGKDPELYEKYKGSMEFYIFMQYEFFSEWSALKAYANSKGIEIMGDIPIYVAPDSADVWSEPYEFMLDERLNPKSVAGVPPDAFSADGQLWGNPLYDWERMRDGGYDWWVRRISHAAEMYDKVRIDHFLGFSNFFSIPAGASTPAEGTVVKGPRMDLFSVVKEKCPGIDIVAEDLGMLRDGVEELLSATGFPGMKVIQFSFDGYDNPHDPKNHTKNSVVYTGTHDNSTTLGFWSSLERSARLRYSRRLPKSRTEIVDRLIAYAMQSVAETVIIPMQDYLHLGDEARINAPSTKNGNWGWIMPSNYRRAPIAKRIKNMAADFDRAAFL